MIASHQAAACGPLVTVDTMIRGSMTEQVRSDLETSGRVGPWPVSIFGSFLQQLARNSAELITIVLGDAALAEPPPIDVAEIAFAWIRAELGAGRKMLDLVGSDRELFA